MILVIFSFRLSIGELCFLSYVWNNQKTKGFRNIYFERILFVEKKKNNNKIFGLPLIDVSCLINHVNQMIDHDNCSRFTTLTQGANIFQPLNFSEWMTHFLCVWHFSAVAILSQSSYLLTSVTIPDLVFYSVGNMFLNETRANNTKKNNE